MRTYERRMERQKKNLHVNAERRGNETANTIYMKIEGLMGSIFVDTASLAFPLTEAVGNLF